jgi:hypothetical protein
MERKKVLWGRLRSPWKICKHPSTSGKFRKNIVSKIEKAEEESPAFFVGV